MAKKEKVEETPVDNKEVIVEQDPNVEVTDTTEEIIPVESGAIISDDDTKGITISEEVVATIAGLAAQEVKGVAAMNATGLVEMFGRKTKGVKVQIGEKDTVIDINVTIEYGGRIPDIAWEVQNKVKTQVETMTGLNVVAVNVYVQGVAMPKKKQEIKEQPQQATSNEESIKEE